MTNSGTQGHTGDLEPLWKRPLHEIAKLCLMGSHALALAMGLLAGAVFMLHTITGGLALIAALWVTGGLEDLQQRHNEGAL